MTTLNFNASQVEEIKAAIYTDDSISLEEVKELFRIKDEAESVTEEFTAMFVEAVMNYLTEDSYISFDELEEIDALVYNDSEVDATEAALITAMENFPNYDENFVSNLRAEIFEDGVVTIDEVDSLFEIKDVCAGKTSTHFNALFVEAVMAYLLADEIISAEELVELKELIDQDEILDQAELDLLKAMRDSVKVEDTTFFDAYAEFLA